MQLFFDSRTVGATQTCAKTEFNAKYPFKVMHFGITEKLTVSYTDSLAPHCHHQSQQTTLFSVVDVLFAPVVVYHLGLCA